MYSPILGDGQVISKLAYFYNDSGQLTKAIDSAGNEVDYTYDAVGNITQITRGQAPASGALAILNFTPQSGAVGATVTISGQNFSTTAASNAVKFNGVAATVVSATATSVVVTVPTTATTGLISVTVGANTAKSATNFTVIASPDVVAITPNSSVSSSQAVNIPTVQVTGVNLTGATFAFSPAFAPPNVAVNSVTINPGGTSATLNVTVAAGASGTYTLMATNASGTSSTIATATNTLHILSPNNDDDGDGLTNAVEIAIGTNPLNPDTSGAGLPDGWQVFYGLNPLNPSVASQDLDNSGLTVLQDFQQGLSPRNPSRVPPAVAKTNPANGATGVFINAVLVARFAEPLLTGTTLLAAQNAITAALGATSTILPANQQTAAATLQSYMNRTCCGNSVIPGTVSLSGPAGPIQGGIATSSDGLSVTFAPSIPLSANTTYTAFANGVRDAAGNLMTKAFTNSFTTGSAIDTTVPAITLVDPENGAAGVPVNAHYTVQFSKTMDPASLTPSNFSITDTTSGQLVAGTVQTDADEMTAAFIPSSPLPVASNFRVAFTTGVKDTAGNPLAGITYDSFSTGDQAETAAPHWVTNSPANAATGVPLNANVDLLFTEPLDIATVAANIQVTSAGASVPVMVALSQGDQRVTLTPSAPLHANATYAVTIGSGIADIAGLTLDNAGGFSFQTGALTDSTPLSITEVDPTNTLASVPLNTLVRLRFNKPIDAASAAPGSLELYPRSVGYAELLAGKITLSSDRLTATMTPPRPLLPETQYCIYVAGIVDQEGSNLEQDGSTPSCFTTGTTAATAGPTVLAISPANAATAVPVNATVQAEISAPISTVTIAAGAIAVTAGVTPVAGSVTVVSPTVVRFTPSTALAVNTAYTVKVGNFTDLAGNAVTAFTSGFTTSTSSAPAAGPLTVTAITPATGSSGVAVTTPVVVKFNEPVNPLTVTAQSVNVQVNGNTLAGNYVVAGATVTFTPLTALPGGATVLVYVDNYAAVQDLAANNGGYASASFTTAATTDTTAPKVASVTPLNGAIGIGSNGQVVVTFSKSMNPATIRACCTTGGYSNLYLLAGETRLRFDVTLSADNRTLTLSGQSLPPSTVITLAITHGVTDLSGNALPDFTSQFTTAAAIDTTHGSVINQRPGNGATGVSLNASPIVLFLNVPLNVATVQAAVHVAQNGQLVTGTTTLERDGQTIEFTPSSPWAYGAVVQVFLDATAQDVSANTVTAYQSSFTTLSAPATTAPAVVSYSPANSVAGVPLNAIIDAEYSEPLSAATVNATNVFLNGPAGRVASTLTLDATGTVIHLTPGSALTASSEYCFYLENLEGTNGLAVQYAAYCFTTGTAAETAPPVVVAVSPADTLTGVPLNARISVLFSGPVDPLTVSGTTIQVSGGGQTEVPASISFANNNKTVEITPEAALPAATVMTLTIAGVKDVAGNTVATHTTHFTTGTAPATATTYVIAENPSHQTNGVPLNALISIEASAAIDATTLSGSSFDPYDYTVSKELAGTYSLSADALTASFVPSAPLAAGRQYSVYFNGRGLTDLTGNLIVCCASGTLGDFYFTSGYTASSAGPQVTGVNPPNGLRQVPTNPQIVVKFNEPVDAESLGAVKLAIGAASVPSTTSLSNDNQTLTLTPSVELGQNTLYTLTVAGVTDFSRNPMKAPFTSTFTTGLDPDFSQLSITGFDPANNLAAVPLNVRVTLAFNKPIDASTAGVNSVEIYPRSVGLAVVVTGKVVLSTSGTNLTMTPSSPLLPETQYCVYVNGIADEEGNNLAQDGGTLTCFTTGTSAATAGSTVVGVSPANGTTGAPVNAIVQAVLSAPISTATVGAGAIALTAGGIAAAGTVTVVSPTELSFTPSAALAVNTAYTVKIGGFTDLAGNPVTAFTSGFTTSSSATPARGPLDVTAITPANASAGVAVTTPVVVTFNEAVNPLTITAQSVNVQVNGVAIAGSYAVSGETVTFKPLTALPAGAVVGVYVDYYASVQDLAGNSGQYATVRFTTASTADNTIPKVVSVTPVNGATGIGLNGQVVVTFSKSMNPATLRACCTSAYLSNVYLLAGETPIGFNVSISADNRTLTLSGQNLPPSTVITVVVTHGATDLSGNALVDFSSQFTTAAAIETAHASVVNQRPGNAATGVPVNASPIVLFLNTALNAATVPAAVHVSQNGQIVAGSVSVEGDGQTVEFTPSSPWAYGAQVQVFLDATALDVSGNPVTAYQSSFTTVSAAATTAPALVSYSPVVNAAGVPLNAILDAKYSEPLSAATVNTTNVFLNGPAGRVASTVVLDASGTLVHLMPGAALTASSSYCFYLQNLQGTNGLAGQYVAYCFTTGTAAVTVAPTVVAVSPANALTGVPLNARTSVLFSAPVDPLTVSGSTILVSGGGQTEVPASISFANNNQTVEITPEAALPAAAAMTLTIAGVKDVAGNTVATHTTHFTTGTAPATANTYVIAENPTYQTTGVPLNAIIRIRASAAIDATTLNSSTFKPTDDTLGTEVAGTYSLSSDALTASFVPSAPLAASRQYSVYFNDYGLTDLTGNPVTCCATGTLGNFYFTTGLSPSSAGPVVTGVNPLNAALQVATNVKIAVQFNEPVDADSLGAVRLTAAGVAVPFTTALSNNNQLLTLTPSVELAANTLYTLTVAGVTDFSGNAIKAPFTSTFTTSADPSFTLLPATSYDLAKNLIVDTGGDILSFYKLD